VRVCVCVTVRVAVFYGFFSSALFGFKQDRSHSREKGSR